jgi:aldo/keto reductase family protein
VPCGIEEDTIMEYRSLGASGLKVSVLSFGTGTFGGEGPLFSAWGRSGVDEARRLVDICLDAGVNLFDSADVYSNGASEEILGAAISVGQEVGPRRGMGETIHNMRRRGDQPSAADFLQVSSDEQLPREPLNFRSLSSSFFATTELTLAFGGQADKLPW